MFVIEKSKLRLSIIKFKLKLMHNNGKLSPSSILKYLQNSQQSRHIWKGFGIRKNYKIWNQHRLSMSIDVGLSLTVQLSPTKIFYRPKLRSFRNNTGDDDPWCSSKGSAIPTAISIRHYWRNAKFSPLYV